MILFQNIPRECFQELHILSNHIQNDILEAMKIVILRQFKNEVRGQPVDVITDETSDEGHREQIAIVIRYIPLGLNLPIEGFVSLKRLKRTLNLFLVNK